MIGFANNLSYYFNTVAENLVNIQTDINAEIKIKWMRSIPTLQRLLP